MLIQCISLPIELWHQRIMEMSYEYVFDRKWKAKLNASRATTTTVKGYQSTNCDSIYGGIVFMILSSTKERGRGTDLVLKHYLHNANQID